MADVPGTSVRRAITVPVRPEDAFVAFTDQLAEFEPPEGTRWQIFVSEPPGRLVLRWYSGAGSSVETDPDRASEVEIRFLGAGPRTTDVVVEHRHLDQHGSGWEDVRAGVAGDQGWRAYLTRFAAHVTELRADGPHRAGRP